MCSRFSSLFGLAAMGLVLTLTQISAAHAAGKSRICGGSCKEVVVNHLNQARLKLSQRGSLSLCSINNGQIPGNAPRPQITVDMTGKSIMRETTIMNAFLIKNSSRYFFIGDASAGRRAIAGMLNWAQADAHKTTIVPPGETELSTKRWNNYGLMLIFMNSLFLLDDHPDLTEANRAVIWAWIERSFKRGKLSSSNVPRGPQKYSNHNARRALVVLLYGIHKSDDRLIKKSTSLAQRSYSHMDGYGIREDAERGNWALNYINFGIDSLVLHTAFMSIIDPSYPSNKRNNINKLAASADFLFRESVQPNQIHQYAKAGKGSINRADGYDGRQDIWWDDRHWGGIVQYAWIDADVIPVNPRRKLLRQKYSDTGGLVSCWFP